jgi:hypothetical protein
MKPGFGPVFQFRAAFSLGTSVDDLWMALKIVERYSEPPDSPQQRPVSKSGYPLVRYSVGP